MLLSWGWESSFYTAFSVVHILPKVTTKDKIKRTKRKLFIAHSTPLSWLATFYRETDKILLVTISLYSVSPIQRSGAK